MQGRYSSENVFLNNSLRFISLLLLLFSFLFDRATFPKALPIFLEAAMPSNFKMFTDVGTGLSVKIFACNHTHATNWEIKPPDNRRIDR